MLDDIRKYFCLHKKFLLFNLVSRNLKLKYRESILGYLWTLLIPITQTAIFYFLFGIIFKVAIPNYPLYLVVGLLPWMFFSITLSESMESIGGNGALLNQMPIPIQIFPNTSAMTNFVNLLASVPIIIFMLLSSHIAVSFQVLLVLPLIFALYVIALSMGIILSIIYVYFRDLRHITSLVLQIWYYVTPVVYSKDMVPEKLRGIVFYLNPVSGIFLLLRDAIFGSSIDQNLIFVTFGWTCFLFLLSLFILKKFGSGVVERL